jgi:photosystem II stability/assembly factor-like uncharacterized protein
MKTISYQVRLSSIMFFALCFPLLAASPAITRGEEPRATNVIYQSNDGGQTWQDISQSLPEKEQPEDFFAGESDLYVRVKNVMYRSKSNLKTPVWEKENSFEQRNASIAFNRSGVTAFNYEGQVYQKKSPTGNWLPVYTNFRKYTMRTIFEAADGTVFLGSDQGLFKSADKGKNWKQVQHGGWVMEIVEADGVLVATSQGGIIRSTDQGEHWESVISEGGVGIAIERIDGGFAAISFNSKTQSRRIRISLDHGKTWQAIDEQLAPSMNISSIKQVGKYLVVGHPDGIFRTSDMGKTWNMVHPSVEKIEFKSGKAWKMADFNGGITGNVDEPMDDRKVFKIYVSGPVLYAVARNGGC